MRFSCFLWLLIASMAFAQAAPSAPKSQPAKPSLSQEGAQNGQAATAANNVPPDAAVITIKGLCDNKAASATAKDCQTVITRAQFEKMAEALQPNMPPAVRQRFGNAYPHMLVMAREAEKRGLDKGSDFDELMQYMRMQVLSQELQRSLQEQAAQVSDKDIADYYRDNNAAYEQVTVQRIFVPRRKMVDAAKDSAKGADAKADPKAQEEAAEEVMKKEADTVRGRAAAGEDFDKLQKEAYDAAALKGNAPSTNIGKMRRTNIPPAHAGVFELKAGEVSQVISDGSGYYIYKVESKDVLPLEQAKEEIHNTLQSQRLKDSMQALNQSTTTELNEAYFGNTATAPAPVPAKPNSGAGSKQPAKTPLSQPK